MYMGEKGGVRVIVARTEQKDFNYHLISIIPRLDFTAQ